jgi:hypothetical protein
MWKQAVSTVKAELYSLVKRIFVNKFSDEVQIGQGWN